MRGGCCADGGQSALEAVLRGQLGISDLPVMVVTALAEAESQALALELGADDYVSKPFNPKILRARTKTLFRSLSIPDLKGASLIGDGARRT